LKPPGLEGWLCWGAPDGSCGGSDFAGEALLLLETGAGDEIGGE